MIQTINRTILAKIYKNRPQWSHKGNYGNLLIIGGSKKYSGSPTFAALAAIKSGVDLTTIVAPKRAADIAASFSPDLITEPLDGDYINRKHLKTLLALSKEHDAVVIGGGLEKRAETMKTVEDFLTKNEKPCVIDADAISAIVKMKRLKPNHVLTPHAHEFYEVTKTDPVYDHEERVKQASDLAVKKNCVVLLKGSFDIITNGKNSFINTTGNPFMTKGGTGDTLAGICGAILARGNEPIDAGCGAAFINGAAGDLAARKYGESLLASNIVDEISHIVK